QTLTEIRRRIDLPPAETTRLDCNQLVTGCRANAARWLLTSITQPRKPLHRGSGSLEHRKHLLVRAVSIARTDQLAACDNVFTVATQSRADDGLVGPEFASGCRIIVSDQSHNLILTVGKGKEQKSCACFQVWVRASRHLDQRVRAKHLACDGTAGSRMQRCEKMIDVARTVSRRAKIKQLQCGVVFINRKGFIGNCSRTQPTCLHQS